MKKKKSKEKNNFWSVLIKIAVSLKKHPVLLLTFGFGTILLAVVAVVSESYRIVSLALLVLFVLGIVFWFVTEIIREKQLLLQKHTTDIKSGRLNISNTASDEAKMNTGNISYHGSQHTVKVSSGDVSIDNAKIENSQVKSGNVNIEVMSQQVNEK